MKAVLLQHGSVRLKRDIARHGADFFATLTEQGSVQEITLQLHALGYLDSIPLELSATT